LRSYQSIERTELLATFTEPVVATIAAFAMLESSSMQEPHGSIRTREKIMSKLSKFFAAKDTRAQFAAISAMLHEAMVVLNQAVNAIDLVIDAETRKIVGELKAYIRLVIKFVGSIELLQFNQCEVVVNSTIWSMTFLFIACRFCFCCNTVVLCVHAVRWEHYIAMHHKQTALL
jgi:hypothetical protein